MSQLADFEIKDLAVKHKMITPFVDQLVRDGGISYGLSSYGYDARLSEHFKLAVNTFNAIIDPLKPDPRAFIDIHGESITIPPHGFVLGATIEHFKIPRNVLVTCLGKSTYARSGIIVNVTPLEPEWEGNVTLEFANQTPNPVVLHANQGACQFIFWKTDFGCHTSYADRKGKYQGQRGVTMARADKVK